MAAMQSPNRRRGAAIGECGILARRSLIRMRRTPEALMDVVAQPVLFLLMFAFLFGGAVSGSIGGYAQFLVPGVLVQTVVVATLGLGVTISTDIRSGFFDRLRSLPISRVAPLAGAAVASTLRYCVAVVVCLAVGLALGWRAERGIGPLLLGVAVVIGFGFCLSWLPLLVGLLVRSPSAVQGVLLPLVFPLTFASSAFVPPGTVPGWLRFVMGINPVSQVTSSMRGLASGGDVGAHLTWSLIWMAGMLLVLVPWSVAALRRLE